MPSLFGNFRQNNYQMVLFVTLSHQGEKYALGEINPIYHGLGGKDKDKGLGAFFFDNRVDELENVLLTTELGESIRNDVSIPDDSQKAFVGVYLYLASMGLELDIKELKALRFVDTEKLKLGIGSILEGTRVLHLELGEKRLSEIQERIDSSAVGDYQSFSVIKINQMTGYYGPYVAHIIHDYYILHDAVRYKVDPVSWRLFVGFKSWMLNVKKAAGMDLSDSRQLSSFNRALEYIRLRDYQSVKLTLFSDKTNELSAATVHSIAVLLEMDDENLAYRSLKPKRLLLHYMLSYISVLSHEDDRRGMLKKVKRLTNQFVHQNGALFEKIEDKRVAITSFIASLSRKKVSVGGGDLEHTKSISRLREIEKQLRLAQSDKREELLYHLDISIKKIPGTVLFYELFHDYLATLFDEQVPAFVEKSIANGDLKKRHINPKKQAHFIGMTGGVASGKTAIEEDQTALLPEGDPIGISSDSWNELLTEFLALDKYSIERGILSLGEAWFIKSLIWRILSKNAREGITPHIIQEAMNPLSLRIPEGYKARIFVNTASPKDAVRRMKNRYSETGRYVPVSNTLTSYRNLWTNVLACLQKGMGQSGSQISIYVMDTDQYYTGDKTPILSIQEGVCQIYSLHRLLSFVNRNYMMHHAPLRLADIWTIKHMDNAKTTKEVSKLFDESLGLTVECEGNSCSLGDLQELIESRCQAASQIQEAFRGWKQSGKV